jgi:amino acid permease
MLRKAILGYGVVAIAIGVLLAVAGVGSVVILYLCAQGVIVIAALLFERGRYRPNVTQSGNWQDTEERFVDPSTGQLMQVRYNPQTGARDYVAIPPPQTSLQGGGTASGPSERGPQ